MRETIAAATVPLLAFGAGILVGWLHFATLAAVTHRMLAGRPSAVIWQVSRLSLVAVLLILCARIGVAALLAAALGLFIGRARALRGAHP